MKCPKCGAELTGTEKFCYDCGSEISQIKTESTNLSDDNNIPAPVVEPANQNLNGTSEVSTQGTPNVSITEKVESVPVDTTSELNTVSEIGGTSKPPKNNKTLIIIAVILLLIVLGAGGFFVFKDYFIKDNDIKEEPNTDIVEPVVPDSNSLICNKVGTGLSSIASLNFVDGKLMTYSMNYNVNTTGMSVEDVNKVLEEYDKIFSQMTVFENEVGFTLNVQDVLDEEFMTRSMTLNYIIDVQTVTNSALLELIGNKDMTLAERTADFEDVQGYICN